MALYPGRCEVRKASTSRIRTVLLPQDLINGRRPSNEDESPREVDADFQTRNNVAITCNDWRMT